MEIHVPSAEENTFSTFVITAVAAHAETRLTLRDDMIYQPI